VLYIVSSGLRGGARAGSVAALGITAGCCVHIAAATVGLGALVATSATAFLVLKWVGAAYLVYVGLSSLLRRTAGPALTGEASPTGNVPVDLRAVFLRGLWTNVLNPKVAVFFLAFLPQFIAPDAADKTLTFLALGLLFNLNALPVNLGYGLAAAWLSDRLREAGRLVDALERAAGGLFIYFGLRLALQDTPHN
jgi:threonine/homoserine/homoserine lactone efflux protein